MWTIHVLTVVMNGNEYLMFCSKLHSVCVCVCVTFLHNTSKILYWYYRKLIKRNGCDEKTKMISVIAGVNIWVR